MAQTLLNVPYGEGDGEKLDVYVPKTNSLGMDVCDFHDSKPHRETWHWKNLWELTGFISFVSDVPLVIYLHGGYWQFLRYSVTLSQASGL